MKTLNCYLKKKASKMKYFFIVLTNLILFCSCSKEESINASEVIPTVSSTNEIKSLEIKGAELSFLPEIRQSGIVLKNRNNQTEDMLQTLKREGVNTIRLRLWKNPLVSNSSFETVKNLASEIKGLGLKVLVTVHYSDTWADPGSQTKPALWQSIPFNDLKDSVSVYTKKIVTEINPDYIQIGNEINNGLLWPEGSSTNINQMKQLLQAGISAVRQTNSSTKIIIHFAGHTDSDWFFTNMASLDYDIIGISYYPKWHGKDLTQLKQNLISISTTTNKPIFIAETSYGFIESYNDWTDNIMYSQADYLPQFPLTPNGQKDYLNAIKALVVAVPKGIGFCYWGNEWISYKGNQATDGSSWENQAFWDFSNKALPVLSVYN